MGKSVKKTFQKFVLFLKGVYQTLMVKMPLLVSTILAPNKNQWELLSFRLKKKKFHFSNVHKTIVLAIYAELNWEKVFKEQLDKLGEVHYFPLPEFKQFFNSRVEWEQFHYTINKQIQKTFSELYEIESNFLVFLYTGDFFISTETLKKFNLTNSLIISFCWDDLLYFKASVRGQPVGVSNICKYVDINLTMSPEAISRYNIRKSPCFFWESIPINKDIYLLPEINSVNEFYVLFIGSKYGWRAEFINNLRKRGIKVNCFGAGWENGYMPDIDMAKAIQQAPLTLGFSNVGYTRKITTIKGRDFEVPLNGGLYLTQFSAGLEKYYEVDEDILVYHDFEECFNKIQFIKENPLRALDIRRRGFIRANTYGSWDARFAYLNNILDKARNTL